MIDPASSYGTDKDLTLKIITLGLLSNVDFPLSSAQICDFFIEKEYTDYFTIQGVLSSLSETEMITVNETAGITYYRITEEGEATARLFPDRLSDKVMDDIRSYCNLNSIEMKKRNSVIANYYPQHGSYAVHCKVSEDDNTVMDITLKVPTEELARTLCTNWRVRYDDVYAVLINTLS